MRTWAQKGARRRWNLARLQRFPAGQVVDQTAVVGEEIVLGQVFEAHPDHLGEDAIMQVPAYGASESVTLITVWE